MAAVWTKAGFEQLPGWANANQNELLKAFAAQCAGKGSALARKTGTPEGLLKACENTQTRLASGDMPPAQFWLEANFDVWQFQKEDGSKTGLMTGYYEPELTGARKKDLKNNTPLYGVPSDLITVKLDSLYPELKHMRLRGRLQGNTLVPFFDRANWDKIGPEREKPIVWVNDKLDAFLLQVQGSGRVELPDGKVIRLSYADQNGQPYKSIGKVLVDRGELTVENATVPGIRDWANKHPDQLDALLNENPSVIFFKESEVKNPELGPTGALGVPLTGGLSLAVDRSLVPYGSLLWIESSNPQSGKPITQGALAQDTGGAIRGRVRADYFWGTGKKAGELAGITRQPLKMWLIWPKDVPLPAVPEKL